MAAMTRRLGRYELHDVLGAGAFATVYRASDPSLEATVAVKVLADNWSRVPEVRRRFRAEAVLLRRAQASGSIQGLIEVYDIDEDDAGQPYFVMGFADQGTLADRRHDRLWSAADVAPVIDALAETVGALHDNQIVHRDLKPTNVLLRSDGRANTPGPGRLVARHERLLVSDLGLAKDLRRQTSSLSLAGGTHRYQAPEQLDLRAAVDHRADVHAATAIIAVLMTGAERPSERSGPGSAVGPPLGRAFERGLSSDPDQRYQSMSSWRQGLFDAIEDGRGRRPPATIGAPLLPVRYPQADMSEAPEALLQLPDRPGSRRRWVVLGAGALTALVAVAWLVARLVAAEGIVGPDEVVVGETVRYRAPASPDEPILWIGPNGEQVRDEDLAITAVVPGQLRIELFVDGDRRSRTVRARPSPLGPLVDGPDEARAGEAIVLTPSLQPGDRSHYWLDPGGDRVDEERLELAPATPGTLSVTLVAIGPDGIERGVRHRVEVIS